MILKELILRNFLSFEKLNFKFVDEPNAIQGVNDDQDDQESNGAGKSSLFHAIEYAILNSTSASHTDKELIKYGETKAYINLDIYCPIRKQTLQIERNINDSPKLALTIVSDDGSSEPIEFANTPDGNNQLINWIGISKSDISDFYIISSKKHTSFMTSSNTVKLQMLSRLVDLDRFSSFDNVIKNKIQSHESELSALMIKDSKFAGQIEEVSQYIDSEKSRDFKAELKLAKQKIDDEIEKLKVKVSSELSRVEDNELKISSVGSNIKKLSKELKELSKFDKHIPPLDISEFDGIVDGIVDSISEVNEMKSEAESQILDLKSKINIINRKKAESVECPSCGAIFTEDEELDIVSLDEEEDALVINIQELKSMKLNLNSVKEKYELEMADVNRSIESKVSEHKKDSDIILGIRKEANAKENSLMSMKSKLQAIKIDSENCFATVDRLSSRISELEEKKGSLELGSVDKSRLKGLKDKLKKLKASKIDLSDEIGFIEYKINELRNNEFNIRKFFRELSEESLKVIEFEQNNVLKKMKSDIRIKWNGFKLKSDGTFSDKINPIVLRNGSESNFRVFSGGERGRIEYSSILSIQEIINSVHPYGGLKFLMTDEVKEGIDALGLKNILDALGELGQCILLTTHVVNQSVSTNIITIRKKNGSSEILNN